MAQVSAVTGMPYNKRSQTLAMQARLANLPSILAQKTQAEYQKAQIENMQASQELENKRFGIEQGKFNLAQQEYGLKEKQFGLEEGRFGLAQQEYGLNERRYGLEEQGLAQQQKEFGWQQSQANKARSLQEDTQARQMGVQAAGLGFNLLGSGVGSGMTIGGLTSKISDLWGGLFNKGGSNVVDPEMSAARGTSVPMQTVGKTGGMWDFPLAPTVGGGVLGIGVGKALGGTNKMKSSLIGAGVGGLASFLGSQGNWGSTLGGGLLGGLGGLF